VSSTNFHYKQKESSECCFALWKSLVPLFLAIIAMIELHLETKTNACVGAQSSVLAHTAYLESLNLFQLTTILIHLFYSQWTNVYVKNK
jgi:hypothetical protein